MFKSRIEENLKADEIGGREEDEGVCYEIVKEDPIDEKPLTLEEARKMVEKNYFLNKEALSERFEDIFGANSDALLKQYMSSQDYEDGNFEENERIHRFNEESSSEDEEQLYTGRGYSRPNRRQDGEGNGPDIDEDLPMEDGDEICGTIHSSNHSRKSPGTNRTIPMTNYGKGPPPFWSNVFDDASSDGE